MKYRLDGWEIGSVAEMNVIARYYLTFGYQNTIIGSLI